MNRSFLSLRDLIIYGVVLVQPIAPVGIFGISEKASRGHVTSTILLAMVAGSAAVARDRHIRIEYFSESGSMARRKRLSQFGAVMVAALFFLIAFWGTNALRAIPDYSAMPIRFQTQIDGMALAFAILLGLVCGLLFGLAPALQLSRLDPQRAIRSGLRSSGRCVDCPICTTAWSTSRRMSFSPRCW